MKHPMMLPTTIIVKESEDLDEAALLLFASVMDQRGKVRRTVAFHENDNHPLTNGSYDDDGGNGNLTFHLETNAGVFRFNLNSCGGQIIEHLDRQTCPFCAEATCYHGCDESVAEFVEKDSVDQSESEEEVAARREHNAFYDALETLTVAHAFAGVDVRSVQYIAGLNRAIDGKGKP